MKATIAFALMTLQPVVTGTTDDIQLLRQLGYIAGQAVACDIEQPDVAAQIATAMADAMGLKDEVSHRMKAEQALSAAAQPCAAPAGRLDQITANWKAMRKRAGVD